MGRVRQAISELAFVVLQWNDIQKKVAWSRIHDTKNQVGIYSRASMGLSTMAFFLLYYECLWVLPSSLDSFLPGNESLSFSGLLLSGKTVAQFGLGRHLSGN